MTRPRRHRPAARRLTALGAMLSATLLAGAAAAAQGAPPVADPHDPDGCAGCHATRVEQWRDSPHARAGASPGFLAALRRYGAAPAVVAERCLGCHVPGGVDRVEAATRLLAGTAVPGVVCAACHDGTRAAHPTRYPPGVPASAPAEVCAGCHRWQPPAVACSTVYDGWRASPAAAAGVPCQGCHMPDGSHRFEGSRSPAMLRRGVALRVTAEIGAEGPVAVVELRNLAGHRLPDG